MNTYTVALSDIRHPETGAVLVKRLGIVSPDTANHLRQVYAVDSIHGITVPTYPDAACVVENLMFEGFEQAQRAGARALVRTIYPVVDGEGEGEGDDVLARWLAPTPVVDGASTEEDLAEWLAEEDVRIAAERAERKAKDRADFKAMRALGGGMGSLIRKKAPAPAPAPVVDEFVDFDDLPF